MAPANTALLGRPGLSIHQRRRWKKGNSRGRGKTALGFPVAGTAAATGLVSELRLKSGRGTPSACSRRVFIHGTRERSAQHRQLTFEPLAGARCGVQHRSKEMKSKQRGGYSPGTGDALRAECNQKGTRETLVSSLQFCGAGIAGRWE